MKKIGYLASGLVIGMALTVVTPVLADTAKTISAKLNSTVKVAIDGKNTKLNAQPITYNNLNYLPVGEIGRALGLDVSYDKKTDTIRIDEDNVALTPTTTTSATTVTTPPVETVNEVQKVKIGQSITNKGITVSIDKIEYVMQEEDFNNTLLSKGFKVYTTVTNNSDVGVSLGSAYNFGTGDLITDRQLNYLGNTIFLKVNGNTYQGEALNKGETATGFIFYRFSKDVTIKEISYLPVLNYTQSQVSIGTWEIE